MAHNTENIITKHKVYWIERDSIGLAEYDSTRTGKNAYTSLTSALTVTLFYYKKATHFNTLDNNTAMTEQSEIPLQFHQYLVDRVVQLGYEQKPEMIQMAPYFEQKFEKGIKEGKMFANRGRISGIRHVKQSSF
jgi:hypothetical protein|tara:strand:- start:494 stop:895 length:402 start_codon:yes stop_codon:yes gene_type:complete